MTDDALAIDIGRGRFAYIDAADAHLADWGWEYRKCRTNEYAERRVLISGKVVFESLHRAVMDNPDALLVDHIDGDGLNCRRANLRAVTRETNRRNVAGAQRNSKTGVLGVSVSRWGRYNARIYFEGASINLGSYGTLDEARVARLAAEKELWGIQPRRAAAMAELEGL